MPIRSIAQLKISAVQQIAAPETVVEMVEEEKPVLKKFKRKIRKTAVLPISAAFDEGMAEFRRQIRAAVEPPLLP